VRNCLQTWYVDYKGRKGIVVDWFKLRSVGALQTHVVVSQDPHRRERGKETAALWRRSIESLGTVQVTEGKFKIWIEMVFFFLSFFFSFYLFIIIFFKDGNLTLYSQTSPLLLP